MNETAVPAVGQVWADNDPRCQGRTFILESVGPTYVRVRVLTDRDGARQSMVGKLFAIRKERMRPTRNGYRLVSSVSS